MSRDLKIGALVATLTLAAIGGAVVWKKYTDPNWHPLRAVRLMDFASGDGGADNGPPGASTNPETPAKPSTQPSPESPQNGAAAKSFVSRTDPNVLTPTSTSATKAGSSDSPPKKEPPKPAAPSADADDPDGPPPAPVALDKAGGAAGVAKAAGAGSTDAKPGAAPTAKSDGKLALPEIPDDDEPIPPPTKIADQRGSDPLPESATISLLPSKSESPAPKGADSPSKRANPDEPPKPLAGADFLPKASPAKPTAASAPSSNEFDDLPPPPCPKADSNAGKSPKGNAPIASEKPGTPAKSPSVPVPPEADEEDAPPPPAALRNGAHGTASPSDPKKPAAAGNSTSSSSGGESGEGSEKRDAPRDSSKPPKKESTSPPTPGIDEFLDPKRPKTEPPPRKPLADPAPPEFGATDRPPAPGRSTPPPRSADLEHAFDERPSNGPSEKEPSGKSPADRAESKLASTGPTSGAARTNAAPVMKPDVPADDIPLSPPAKAAAAGKGDASAPARPVANEPLAVQDPAKPAPGATGKSAPLDPKSPFETSAGVSSSEKDKLGPNAIVSPEARNSSDGRRTVIPAPSESVILEVDDPPVEKGKGSEVIVRTSDIRVEPSGPVDATKKPAATTTAGSSDKASAGAAGVTGAGPAAIASSPPGKVAAGNPDEPVELRARIAPRKVIPAPGAPETNAASVASGGGNVRVQTWNPAVPDGGPGVKVTTEDRTAEELTESLPHDVQPRRIAARSPARRRSDDPPPPVSPPTPAPARRAPEASRDTSAGFVAAESGSDREYIRVHPWSPVDAEQPGDPSASLAARISTSRRVDGTAERSPSGERRSAAPAGSVRTRSFDVEHYVVIRGDSFDSVCRSMYGTADLAAALAEFNGGGNLGPDTPLRQGATLRLPPAAKLRELAAFNASRSEDALAARAFGADGVPENPGRAIPRAEVTAAKPPIADDGLTSPPRRAGSTSAGDAPLPPSSPFAPSARRTESVPTAAQAAAAGGGARSGAKRTYVVRANETLYAIAKKTLGDGRRKEDLLRLNPDILRDDQGYITPGVTLVLPES
jgi:hypothetical protein